MKNPRTESSPLRIAVLWQPAPIQAQRILNAIYRRAALEPRVTMRQFDPMQANWRRTGAKSLVEWHPHGVLLRLSDPKMVAGARKLLPGIPFVSTVVMPPGLVDTCVSMDAAEAITLCRDHFRSRGLSHIACFYGSVPASAHTRREPFHVAVPDGHFIGMDVQEYAGISGMPAAERKRATDWLHALPKPAGIMSFEGLIGPHLLRFCQEIGYRIPEDIQLIGVDDVDQCLACEPHLSSVDPPSEGIGEVAMESLLRHLRGGSPPPPYLRVGGSKVIARGSTGLAAVGSGKIATAMRTIETSATRGISAAGIVKQSKVSHTTFYKHFRATTGTTPAQHLREIRLKKACQMLKETDANITEIATACGFSGGNYFARFFRHATGQTPSHYRQQNLTK